MTIFISDIASYQAGIKIAELGNAGFSAVIIKCTENSGYVNPYFAGWIAQAEAINFPHASYHFVHPGNYDAQAANIHRTDPPPVPIWLDTEAGATRDDAYAIADRLRAMGQTVAGVYFGAKPKSGYGGWWRADYMQNPAGTITSVYTHNGGDKSSHWVGQDMWQYGSRIAIPGHSELDSSAFRGTLDELLSHGWFQHRSIDPITIYKNGSTDMFLVHVPEDNTIWDLSKSPADYIESMAVVNAYLATNPQLNGKLQDVPKAEVDAHFRNPATVNAVVDVKLLAEALGTITAGATVEDIKTILNAAHISVE